MAVDHRGGLALLINPDGAAATALASTERQLLDRRDEASFAALVARYGPTVRAVCRSVLPDPADVDDAFQATFLVLARRAGALRDRDHLGPWLHGVARRVALQARKESHRRRRREGAPDPFEPAAPDDLPGAAERRELAALLHAELDRLSAPERSAITLCDLEGLTHQEAADRLGWPLGTVKSRVSRGRDRLRSRLLRRGVALTPPALAAALAGEASAALPPALILATARAASAAAAGRLVALGLISAPAAALTQGALRAMMFAQLKAGAAALVAATAAVVATPTLVAQQNQPDPGGSPAPAARPAPAAVAPPVLNPDELKAQIARAAIETLGQAEREQVSLPEGTILHYHQLLAEAEARLARTPADKVKVVRAYAERVEADARERLAKLQRSLRLEPDPQTAKVAYFAGSKASSQAAAVMQFNDLLTRIDGINQWAVAARTWLAKVEAEASGAAPKPAPAGGLGGSVDAAFKGGGSGPSTPKLRIKTTPADEKRQAAILAKLEERIWMNFENDTPLSDVQNYIQSATQDEKAGLPSGIPIYVDPDGLQDADKTMASTVAIKLEGIPLRTTLTLLLRQLKLGYVVEGGLLRITHIDDLPPEEPATPGGFR